MGEKVILCASAPQGQFNSREIELYLCGNEKVTTLKDQLKYQFPTNDENKKETIKNADFSQLFQTDIEQCGIVAYKITPEDQYVKLTDNGDIEIMADQEFK